MKLNEHDKIKKYDFKSNVLLLPDELKTIKLIIERFGETLSFSIENQIKKTIKIEFLETVINKFSQILKEIEYPIIRCNMLIEGINSNIYVKLSNEIMIYLIDAFLGGDLKNISDNKNLTNIEEKLMIAIVNRILKIFEKSLSKNVNCEIKVQEIIKNIDYFDLINGEEQMGTIKTKIQLENYTGDFLILLPSFILEKILKKNQKKSTETNKEDIFYKNINKIKKIKVECSMTIEIDKIRLKDVINIKPGDCILLDYDIKKPLTFRIENIPKFYVIPGKIGKNLAAKIVKKINMEV